MLPESPPTIVLGANHSGTRLIVDILTALGSDAGRVGNIWREESDFLALHHHMIDSVSPAGWDATIFDLDFLTAFEDDLRFVPHVEEWRKGDAGGGFTARDGRPWHWKCPTSILFLPTWRQVFPDARFVHVERDAVDVACSLLRRREVRGISEGVRMNDVMNDRVRSSALQNYFHLRFEHIGDRLEDLAAAANLTPSAEQLETAAAMIDHRPGVVWDRERSVLSNLWEHTVSMRSRLYRLLNRQRA